MTNWHTAGEPHTPHNALRYWQGVMQAAASSASHPTTPTRNDQPQVSSWQPPLTGGKVVISGLADGPSGQ